jgi:hypothetical protein
MENAMPFISIPNAAEAVIRAVSGGKPINNVFGFQHAGAYSQTDLDNIAAAVDLWVATEYLPLVSVNVAYQEVHVRGLNAIIDMESHNNTNAGTGGVTGASTTNNVSMCVTLRTGHTGRSARGRTYLFPTGVSNLTSVTEFSGTYALAASLALTAMLLSVAGTGWTWVVISRRTLGAPRPTGVTTAILAAESRNDLIDSQRGRLTQGH